MDLSVPSRILTLPDRLRRADAVFCWFASLHSFIPSMAAAAFRKPVVSVVGAYDAANVPEIGFGHMGHPWKRHVVTAVCNASSVLICNSDYAVETVRRNVPTRTPIRRLYHGVEFKPVPRNDAREALALSVGLIRRENLLRKGHEAFVRAARFVPEARFVLAGRFVDDAPNYLRSIGPPNFELRDHLPQAELDRLFDTASVYVQPSAHESFGLSVVEAMGAGEIPVVSRRGALPEVVGDHGIYVDERDPVSIAEGIREGLQAPVNRRAAVATYARERFPLSKRREGLLRIMSEVA